MGSLFQLSVIKGPQRELLPKRLNKIFELKLESCRNKTALSFIEDIQVNQSSLSYGALNEQSNQIANALISEVNQRQLQPNQDGDWIIAVCMQPSDKLISILLSIWKSGAAYLPLDPTFPPNRIQHIRGEAQPILVICDDDVDKNLFGTTTTLTITECLEKGIQFSKSNIPDCDTLVTSGNELALVLYTSGSTGIPKGVRLPHAVLLNRLQWQWEHFPYSQTETVGIFKTALTFVDSVSEIWGPLLNDMTLLIIPKNITKDPEQLVEILERYRIERLVLVPTLLRTLLMYLSMYKNVNLLYHLKSWICSGEPLSITLAREFYNYFEEGTHYLYNFYGSTEIMGDVTYFVCEGKNQLESFDRIPIGCPIDNTIIYLLDADYRPVKLGDIGEIFVSGLNLADGYVNGRDPERFLKNPLAVDSNYSRIYRTGDFGSVNKGTIMFEGRTDSQIKIRGHRVDLTEVERILLTIDPIEKAVVLCYNAGEIDQALLAFVTMKTNKNSFSGIQIETILNDKLTDYMIPQVLILETIPLLVNGKVDRQYLLKLYADSNNNDGETQVFDIDYSNVPNHLLHIAKDLFEIVSDVIGKSARNVLSASSNFYELGGNSLNSIFTVTQLRKKGYFISITEFITAKNLGEVLKKLSETEIILQEESHDKYLKMHTTPLQLEDKEVTINIITSSFYGKADLEQWLKPGVLITDYAELLEKIWEVLVEKDLSFVVRDDNGKAIGVALNFDGRDEPEVVIESKLVVIFEFLEQVEGPIRDNQLPPGKNQILHSFMMGTSEELNAQENIAIINFMETEVLNLAKTKNFAGILTTNTSPLTQQLGSNVYNYSTMLDYQVNEYVHTDGTRPFAAAPDSQRAIVHWKDIRT